MFIREKNQNMVSLWEDTPLNQQRIKAWGLEIYEGKVEQDEHGQLWVAGTMPVKPEPTYQELRAAEYPAIGDQLDMIYWDKVNGSNIWLETIAAVKAKYPKSAEEGEEVAK